MSNFEDDKLKKFITQYGKVDLKKPEGEWREITKHIEEKNSKTSWTLIPKWFLGPVAAACLVAVLIVFTQKQSVSESDLAEFLLTTAISTEDTAEDVTADAEFETEELYLALIEDSQGEI